MERKRGVSREKGEWKWERHRQMGISREKGEWKLGRRQADRYFQRERRVEVRKKTGR